MKIVKPFLPVTLLLLPFVIGSIFFQGCKPDDCDDENEPGECDTCIMVYKPNIYIYPEEKTQLEITLGFPKGGSVVTSVPEYGTGWNVLVDKNGLIDNTLTTCFTKAVSPMCGNLPKAGW